MKYLTTLVLLTFLMACQKEQFAPCEDYDKLVGTWRSIDGDAVDYFEYTENGKCTYRSSLERNAVYRLGYCEKKMFQTGGEIYGVHFGGYFLLDIAGPEEGALTAYFNSTYDTIIGGSGAFNHDDIYIGYERRYVKVK